jgi:ABC-type bacteriocin/lantibiotic exporter with double-glycine peptidase domain
LIAVRSRALLVPEVLQASALDCGPAALASLLAGFGLHCPFDALRDACRTGRDGTSIDSLEAVAAELGLDCEQILVPADHLTLPAAECLPCILVVVQPGGATHFVTLWRFHGRRAQLMDPAVGRRWPTVADLGREIYRHRAIVPAAAWHAWAASEGALRQLAARLTRLGIGAADRRRLLREAYEAAGWQSLAALDAAVRFTHQLLMGGGLRRGRDAAGLLAALLDHHPGDARRVDAPGLGAARLDAPRLDAQLDVTRRNGGGHFGASLIPSSCWSVRPDPAAPAGGETVICEGAVLVRVRGLKPGVLRSPGRRRWRRRAALSGDARLNRSRCRNPFAGGSSSDPANRSARRGDARLNGNSFRDPSAGSSSSSDPADPAAGSAAGWQLAAAFPMTTRGGAATGAVLVMATAGAAAGRLAEAAFFAGALELLPAVPSRRLRLTLLAALLALASTLLLCELAASQAARSLGSLRETGLRLRLAAKLPRLPDRYLRSRLLADLAERAYSLGHLRRGPGLAASALRAGLDAVLATAGIAWLDPALAAAASATCLAAVLLPLLLLPRFEERGRRVRAHAAALGGLYLDVLRGATAIRAHGAEVALRRRHDDALAGWLRSRRHAGAAGALVETTAQALLSVAAASLLLAHVRAHGLDPRALPLVLWASRLLAAGQRLALLAGRDLPLDRALRRRIEEPLAAAKDPPRPSLAGEPETSSVAGACPAEAPAATGLEPDTGCSTGAGDACIRTSQGGRRGVAIELRGVTVEVDGRRLLRDLGVSIPGGQHVALLGRSGAGKSTLIGTLLGWHRPAAGALAIDGRVLDADGLADLRRATAWAAPEVALWCSTLLDNLCYGAAGTAALADAQPNSAAADPGAELSPPEAAGDLAPVEALRAALLLELVPQLPRGFQTPLGEAGGRLSGGEAQRLRFARALLRRDVRLALLDEPFRGLGADQRRHLLAAARARWRRATVLCVTHSPAEAAGFDRLLVLDEGRLVEDGTAAALAARRGSHYRAMLDAEERAAAALRAPGWRRLYLATGRLRELPSARSRRQPPGPSECCLQAATCRPSRAHEQAADGAAPMNPPCQSAIDAEEATVPRRERLTEPRR